MSSFPGEKEKILSNLVPKVFSPELSPLRSQSPGTRLETGNNFRDCTVFIFRKKVAFFAGSCFLARSMRPIRSSYDDNKVWSTSGIPLQISQSSSDCSSNIFSPHLTFYKSLDDSSLWNGLKCIALIASIGKKGFFSDEATRNLMFVGHFAISSINDLTLSL